MDVFYPIVYRLVDTINTPIGQDPNLKFMTVVLDIYGKESSNYKNKYHIGQA